MKVVTALCSYDIPIGLGWSVEGHVRVYTWDPWVALRTWEPTEIVRQHQKMQMCIFLGKTLGFSSNQRVPCSKS